MAFVLRTFAVSGRLISTAVVGGVSLASEPLIASLYGIGVLRDEE